MFQKCCNSDFQNKILLINHRHKGEQDEEARTYMKYTVGRMHRVALKGWILSNKSCYTNEAGNTQSQEKRFTTKRETTARFTLPTRWLVTDIQHQLPVFTKSSASLHARIMSQFTLGDSIKIDHAFELWCHRYFSHDIIAYSHLAIQTLAFEWKKGASQLRTIVRSMHVIISCKAGS